MNLQGRVAFVTGASSGIGKAAVILLAAEGARVCVVSRTEEELRRTVDEIEAAGGTAMFAVADTSKPDDVERAIKQTVERFGRLDVVFANAGVNGTWAPIEDLTPEEWDTTLAINLRGTFLTVKYAIPHLKERGGSVVITSSVNGTRIFSNAGDRLLLLQSAAGRVYQDGGARTRQAQNQSQSHLPRRNRIEHRGEHGQTRHRRGA